MSPCSVHVKHAYAQNMQQQQRQKNHKWKLPATRKRMVTFSMVGNVSILILLSSETSYTDPDQPMMSCNHSHHKMYCVSSTQEAMNFVYYGGLRGMWLHSHQSPLHTLPLPFLHYLDPPLNTDMATTSLEIPCLLHYYFCSSKFVSFCAQALGESGINICMYT